MFPSWMDQAACSEADPDRRGERLAARVCQDCAVRVECLGYAFDLERTVAGDLDGVWGGVTATDRLRARRRAQRKKVAA